MTYRYELRSTEFSGVLHLEYAATGVLRSLTNEASLSPEQIKALSRLFPLTQTDLINLVRLSNTLTATLVQADLSFEHFWETYGFKVDKKEAMREHAKLTDADKLLLIQSVAPYLYYLQVTGIQPIYPQRYISKERFRLDYKTLAKQTLKK